MIYIDATPNPSGAYPNPKGQPFPGCITLTDEQAEIFFQYNGFVTVKDGTATPNTEAWEKWKAEQPDPEPAPSQYIPTAEQSATVMMRAMFTTRVATMDDDTIIQCSGLAGEWEPGNHKPGEVYNAVDQTWECYQAYDNDVYPDIKPGNPSWYTFNRPLHGKSPATARPFVPVQGSHDMYRANEYMIYTDGKIYRCKSDTNYSPDDYAQAWEVAE